MTLLFIGALIFAIGLGIFFMKIFVWLIKCVGFFLFGAFTFIYMRFFVSSELNENGFLNKKLEEERLAEELKIADEENRYNEQVKEEHDKIIYVTLSKTRELKLKYPLADKELFDDYMNGFNSKPLSYCDNIVNIIKQQHFERLEANRIREYSIEEVLLMEKIDLSKQDVIETALYRNLNDYVILVYNKDTNMKMIYTTKDIILAKKITNSIMTARIVKSINNEMNNKSSLNKEDINDIIEESKNKVNVFRNKRQ